MHANDAVGRCQICDAADAIAMLGFEQGATLPHMRCSCTTALWPAQSREPAAEPTLPRLTEPTNTGAIGLPAVDAIAVGLLSSTAIAAPTALHAPRSLPAYPLKCNAHPTAAEIGAIMQRAMDASAAGARPPYPVRPPRASSDHIGLIFVEMPKFRRRQQQG